MSVDRHHISRSLYDPRFEHEACGTGFVARTSALADHEVLRLGLEALARLEHRGALAADGKSGDGAGVLTQIPRRLFAETVRGSGRTLTDTDPFGVGVLFLPPGARHVRRRFEAALATEGLSVVAWREPPLDPAALGETARATLPGIQHAIVRPFRELEPQAFERRLFLARKRFERDAPGAYVCSLSGHHIVYKALCAPHQLAEFYRDLADPRYETAFTLYHSRFSTNTMPSWSLAQPFRFLAHNGEINTLWGNRAWMRSRERELPPELCPVLPEGASDSAQLDAALELLARTGRNVVHGLAMLLVPAWEETNGTIPPARRAFHRYHASLIEPWDGPAAVVFADGRYVGAALDRNGLRPCRFEVTRDGLVVAGSEVGVVDLDPEDVIHKGRLGPGQMLVVDLQERRVVHDDELKDDLAGQRPYGDWIHVRPLDHDRSPPPDIVQLLTREDDLTRLQRLYGYTRESIAIVLTPMAEHGERAVWSMGDDTPVAPLARAERSLYAFFRQRFAQVTNPAIDPLRESVVMSLRTWLGPRPQLLHDGPQRPVLELRSPVLGLGDLAALRGQPGFPTNEIPCVFPPDRDGLGPALDRICQQAAEAVAGGAQLLVLSDRHVGPHAAPIPMALVMGAVHHHLVNTGQRTQVGILVEGGDCWDVHHLAVLVGFGASAVCPWLALTGAWKLADAEGEARTVETLSKGIRKLMSKMGISTVTSYRGAQLFDVLGLADEVVERCFPGAPSPIGGLTLARLADAVLARHAAVFAEGGAASSLPDLGLARFRKNGEHHAWSPPTVRALQRAVGSARKGGDTPAPEAWAAFRDKATAGFPTVLRDLLEIRPAGPPVSLDEVEPAEAIVRRFCTSAMSFGALSPEAHRTLSVAMNRLGARSNTGEGGEDPDTYQPPSNGDRADNKIKQVASGRFGVTAQYLVRAEEIEIKIAQGSKPGEGGQLPGHKVTDLIARLRHSQVGVPLISPPPHHDIYSIEDLAQLIYDLKRCNPEARVGVKLVTEAGVGTVAAGVAKAYADYVVISGHAGGTGASALSSIKHAGSPWELGLAETQQVLVRNGLRHRVRVRVDGGFRTADDVLFGAAFGADEFAFGTAPLVAMGCDMARQCHLNTCPTGIATQKEDLRRKFRGAPDNVVRYFSLLAADVRERLAALGLRSLGELVGRVDLLHQTRRDGALDLSPVLAVVDGDTPHAVATRNDRPEVEEPLDESLAHDAVAALEQGRPFRAARGIRNRDRSVGARVAGALAARWGADEPPGVVELRFSGSAGQSFGAFAGRGMRLILEGAANDYVGKGLSGGELVLRPTGVARRASHRHVILGNVALYGATGGRLFAAGRAGERFAVRNSGAVAVVEGTGDHACEYMTGGRVLILGDVGINVGAGMSGGIAYVFAEGEGLAERVNPEHVGCLRSSQEDLAEVHVLLTEHGHATGSVRAEAILGEWERSRERFWTVAPVAHPARDAEPAATPAEAPAAMKG